jgi:hypothetical protein
MINLLVVFCLFLVLFGIFMILTARNTPLPGWKSIWGSNRGRMIASRVGKFLVAIGVPAAIVCIVFIK